MRKIFAVLASIVFSISGVAQLEFSGIEEIYASSLGLGSIQTLFGTILWEANQGPVEIEYLQSTGTQWIDTGVLARSNILPLEIGVTFTANPASTADYFLGGGDSSSSGFGLRHRGNSSDGTTASYAFGWTRNLTYWDVARGFPYDIVGAITKANTGGTRYFRVNTKSGNGISLSETYSYNFVLFGRNIAGTVTKTKNLRIYYAKIGALDLVPVRIGNVGYMYDKANPTGGPLGNGLYPNAGTGNFILGPDKEVTE
jgi:hypothetical protein